MCETIPCPRCGRITPPLDPIAEVTRLLKWSPYDEMSYVNWCVHKLEGIPVPLPDSDCYLIPILGEAT